VCRFSVGGSTHCNQALALSVGVPGDAVVVSRTLHRSLLLGLVLAGLEPIWVEPEVDTTTGLPVGYSPARVAAALAAHPEAVAVFLSDPSYVGTFSDVGEHARVAHAAGVPWWSTPPGRRISDFILNCLPTRSRRVPTR